MQKLRFFLFCLFLASSAYAQKATSLNPSGSEQSSMLPTTSNKKKKKKFFSPKREKAVAFKRPKVQHTAQYEFYERVEKAAKERQRLLKKLYKAQYSDSRYFGHKHIPKKRPPHKMRFCDECHIRH
jgi:hypothetical protein